MSQLPRWFLRLFPTPFRQRFGAEIEAQALAELNEARRRGGFAAARSLLAISWDLATAALAERFQPTWVGRARPAVEGFPMLSLWAQDLRLAARALRRTPAFTLTAAGTLALALGANLGLFSVVYAVLLKPLPFAAPERLVAIRATAPGSDLPPEFGVSEEFYWQYREKSEQIEALALFNSFTSTLRAGDRVERVRMSVPSNSLYATLGAQPVLGRLPAPEEESRVVVISHQLWQSWFGGDPAVLGKSFEISGQLRQVVGVMAPEFRFPTGDTVLWIGREPKIAEVEIGDFGSQMVARLAPGATPEKLAEELTRLARELPARFGGTPAYSRMIEQHRAVVRPLLDQLVGPTARPLWVLLGAVAVVLLIACANVANLFLVRCEARSRDLEVRRAMGASRRQLVRLQLAESVWVGLLAAGLAIPLVGLVGPSLLAAAPSGIPRLDLAGFDAPTLLFTLAAALGAGLACGSFAAWRGSRTDSSRLSDGGRGATRGRQWLRDGLVVGQTALALVLLIGSGLFLKSYRSLRHVDPGYDIANVFTFQFAPEQEQLRDGPTWGRFHLDFLARLAALPGVESVGLVENVPLNEGTRIAAFVSSEMGADAAAAKRLHFTWTAGDYFRTMGIDVLAGRPFERQEEIGGLGAVVVSRTAANLLWPGQDALGRRLKGLQDSHWSTVVGVVEDVLQDSFRDTPEPVVYYPLVGPTPTSWSVGTPAYVVKSRRADSIAPEIRALIREVAPEAPMYRTFTLAGLASDSMAQLSFTLLTLGLLAGLALLLGVVGLYGVLSYVVSSRRREIGVRMALGASAGSVRRLVVAQGAWIVGFSVALGAGVAVVAARAVSSLLFGVAPLDAGTFLLMSVSLLCVGLAASYLPARRASNVDPMETLRAQ